jgi:DNA-binding LytR/AlgR family response regulator
LLPDVRALATSTALGLATYYPAAIVSYGVLVALGHVVFSPADVTTPTEPEHEIDRLVIREWNRVRFIPLDDIEWIEAANNHVVVHTPVRAYKTRERMSDVEARLDARRFIRVHRSALVSVAGIREVQPLMRGDQAIILKSGGVVRVARSRRQALADVLGVSL